MCGLLFTLSTWSAALVCELQDVVVTAAHRREDVGRGLIAAAEEIARERGCAVCTCSRNRGTLPRTPSTAAWGWPEKTCLYFERDFSGGDAG